MLKTSLLLTTILVAPHAARADHDTAIDGNNGTLALPTGLYVTPLKLTNSVQQPLNPGLPQYPNFVAGMAVRSQLSPDGTTLAIITAGQNSLDNAAGSTDVANTIAVIPLTGQNANTVTGLIQTAYEPHEVTFSADGSWVYIKLVVISLRSVAWHALNPTRRIGTPISSSPDILLKCHPIDPMPPLSSRMTHIHRALLAGLAASALAIPARAQPVTSHVLLISVDGMHEIDMQRWIAGHPNGPLAALAARGITYTNAETTAPSDSFPGLLAGLNFRSVSVGQKLAKAGFGDDPALVGGYTDADATPGHALALQLQYVDEAIGAIVAALESNNHADDTTIIVSAKHGQSPIDPAHIRRIKNGFPKLLTEDGFAFAVTDDTALIWLDPTTRTPERAAAALKTLQAN